MPKDSNAGHAVENFLLILLSIFLPPAAVACVTGCGLHFVLNLICTLFLSWIGGIIHAICIVVIYGFREEETTRERRQARLRARQKPLYYEPAPPPPRYETRPAPATGAQEKVRAENVYVVDNADSGSAFARGSANTTRGGNHDLGVYPQGDTAPGSDECGETSAVHVRDSGKCQAFS